MRNQPWRFIILSLSLIGLLVACGRADDRDPASITWQSYTNADLGVTLEMPSDWSATLDGSDSLSLDHPKADVGVQVFITPAVDFIGSGLEEPMAFLQLFIDAFASDGSGGTALETLEPLTETTIQGQSAARVKLQGNIEEANGVVVMAALTNPRSLAVVMTVDGTSDNGYDAVLEHILQSVTLSE